MNGEELATIDAVGHAELVRSGQATALELVDAAIERIESANAALNAVIMTDYDAARERAGSLTAADGPLAGVPFLLKDIGATQAGLPVHLGNRALKAAGHVRNDDTVLGTRFRDAGLVTLGKTNLPELGTCPTTQPLAYGPTKNPWDPTRSPAGSSGGAGAAVASGMVPVADANDGGGSTRLPAAWNGLVGLKTSRGRMPDPAGISRLVSELVVSRSVRDTAAVLDATHGATAADLFQLAPPARPYGDELSRPLEDLRIGVLTDGGVYDVDHECRSGADGAAAVLEAQGHHVEQLDGSVLFGGDGKLNGQLWMAAITRRIDALGDVLGRPLTEDEVEPYNWAAAQRGRGLSASEWSAAQEAQQGWARRVYEWLEPYDILITPTAGCPPMRTSDLVPPEDKPWRIGRTYGRIGCFTLPFNVTGHPAISLPLHWTPDGLPVGVQFVARLGAEDVLLRLASFFEQAQPWASHYPA